MRSRAILILQATLLYAVSSAAAAWRDLAPRPFDNAIYVEGFASYEADDNRGGISQFGWDDTFLKEQVTLYSRGYFYHPRFLQYLFSLSGALKQENYQPSDSAHLGWMTGTGVEYEARLFFLPEHSYNLELFALRYEPLYKEQSATQHSSVETSNGAQFRYRRRPFFFHSSYLDNTTSTPSSEANVKRLSADGQYYESFGGASQLSLNGLATHSWFDNSAGLDGTTRDYAAGGYFDFTRARVSATLTKSLASEDSAVTGSSDNDRFSFNELLAVHLPAQFRTELSYRVLDNTATRSRAGTSTSELNETTREVQFDLTHRLYQSLDSRYTFLRSDRTSTTGDSTLTTQSLDFAYGKNIPRGRVTTDLTLARNDTDNNGRIDVVSEEHPGTAVPGAFLLRQQNVDPEAVLDVSIPSPLPPFETIHLVRGVDYTVTPVGTSVEITILPLGPPFAGPGTYDVTATYSLLAGQFELLTDSTSINASVSLLDNLLTPYVEYVTVRSDVVSGTFPGLNLDSTLKTVGLSFVDGPWRALGEYQSLEWPVSPFDSWKGEVQYVGSLRPTTRIHAAASYLHRYYPIGTSSQLSVPYTDQTTTASFNFQQDLLSRSMTLAAGATYSRQQGQVHGDTFSLSASMNWRIGKLDMSAGASGYGSENEAYTALPYSRFHQYYYLRIRRQFSK